MKKNSGEKTLFASVILSSPGPIVVGLGLLMGKSSTQLADFVRRSAELIAIIVSWAIFKVTHKDGEDATRKTRLESMANLCVGLAMCLSGAVMMCLAFMPSTGEKGNVIPGLVIAILGVTTNTWFWRRYNKLNTISPNTILAVQSRLYRAKSLVDACVTAALTTVAFWPGSAAAQYMDILGSAIVAIYLMVNGVIAIFSKKAAALEST